MDKLIQQNPLLSPPSSNPSGTDATNPPLSPLSPSTSTQTRPPPPIIGTPPRVSETSEVVVYPSSVSLRVSINKKTFFFFKIFVLLLLRLFAFALILTLEDIQV
jgi:hypothetical protein